jgi:hypothetical protein
MGRTLATPTTTASNSGEVPHTVAAVDSMNVASLAVEKLNGCEEEVDGVAAKLCAVGFWAEAP